jgi:HSP20 family protein
MPSFPSIIDEMLESGMDHQMRNTVVRPAVNIRESESDYSIELSVPGFEKSDIAIDVNDNTLIIKGEVKKEDEKTTTNYTRKEFSTHSFERHFNLPEGVSVDGIKAEYVNGILKLSIPKQEVEKAPVRTIEIS